MEDQIVWKANYTPETKELLKKLSKAKLMIIPSLSEVDMSGYKSPIEVIVSDMVMKEENQVMQAVWNVGVNVDKEELVKALAYDRDQYAAGYRYAKEKFDRPHGEWEFCGDNLFKCTHCGYIANGDYLRDWKVYTYDAEFPTSCLKCGADMKEGEAE